MQKNKCTNIAKKTLKRKARRKWCQGQREDSVSAGQSGTSCQILPADQEMRGQTDKPAESSSRRSCGDVFTPRRTPDGLPCGSGARL